MGAEEATSFLCCEQWPFRSLPTTSAPQASHLFSYLTPPYLFILRLTVGGGAVV